MPVIPPGHLESLPLQLPAPAGRASTSRTCPDDVVRKGRELYYGLTQWMDEEVGKVLGALAASGRPSNTVVIYTTDHGENMGEHGLWWKNAMYEHARPGAADRLLAGAVEGRPAAGGCVLAGGRGADDRRARRSEDAGDWNGDSMCRWLDDPANPWKDLAVSEYYAHNIASGYAMIRTGQYKYVYHTPADATHPAQRELYDLEADPGEFHNLASDPNQKDRIQKMHAALVKEIGEDPDKTELRCRADYRRGYQRPGQKGKKQASDA